MGLVLGASEAQPAGPDLIGGKAHGLTRLGERVPPWFVISAGLLPAALEDAGLTESVRERLAGVDDTPASAAGVRELVETLRPSTELRAEVEAHLPSIGEAPWAVRSSMVGEDSAGISFAGQLDSFLYRYSVDEVLDAVVRCWGSAFSPHALVYRARHELGGLPRVAVVVQKMVAGQVSGVAFTAHPVTGHRDRTLISAAWGLGEGVVGGGANADHYVWSHDGRELEAEIAVKDVQVVAAGSGVAGTRTVEVEEPRQRQRCLTEAQVASIGKATRSIAGSFGVPMDIEWTIAEDELFLLQARPITRLPPPPDESAPLFVFDNSNIQESYCGVTTPLTFSFASAAYASVYAQTMRATGLPESTIREHDEMLRNMLALVKGRVYYNIHSWYRGLLLLPSFGQNKADMERMMGLQEPVDFVQDEVLTASQKVARVPRLLKALVNLLWAFRRLPSDVPAWLERFDRSYDRIDRASLTGQPLSRLMDVLEQLQVSMVDDWHVPIINDFYVMMSVGRLNRLLAKAGVADVDDLQNRLLGGEEDIESTAPVRMLMTLAAEARTSPDVLAVLRADPVADVLPALRAAHPDFAAGVDRYLEKYGDRSMGELKLETITVREDPSFVIRVLRSYAAREDLDPGKLAAGERKMRQDAEAELFRRLPAFRRGGARRVLERARQGVKFREAMRLNRTRLFGLYRDTYRAIGMRLHEAGQLAESRDVLYLTTQEIQGYYEGRACTTRLRDLALLRKAEFAEYEKVEMPHRVEARGTVYLTSIRPETPADLPADRTLKGIGCYPGVVEAPVQIVRSPQDDLTLDGKILTALRTDPGWAPLFPTCSGILIERGSTLSHSAVVARELGIPAVVGVPGLLHRVRDGQRVRLNGETGIVELPEEPA